MIQRQTFQRNQVDHIPVQVRIGFADKKSVSAVYGKKNACRFLSGFYNSLN